MDGCVIAKNTKIFSRLVKYYGNDESKALSALLSVVRDNEFSNEFLEYRKSKRKGDIPSLQEADDRKTLNDIISFNNLLHPDGNDTILEYQNENVTGYNSVSDRHFCQKIVANEIIDIYTDDVYGKHEKATRTKVDYINHIRRSIGNYLIKRVSEVLNISEEEFKSHFNDDRADGLFEKYIDARDVYGTTIDEDLASDLANIQEYCNVSKELLGKNIDIQEQNLIATIEEMINISSPSEFNSNSTDNVSYAEKFFDTVFRDSRLSSFRDEIQDSTDDKEENAAQESEDDSNDENTTQDGEVKEVADTFDESFRIFNNKDGQYKTFLIHLGEDIKNYFNRLKRLKTASTISKNDGTIGYIYDTNNPIGIADTMTASECAMIMYTYADYSNVNAMIESVKRIAEQVPGFESFIQFYNNLLENRDFANQIYSTFAKMVIAKKETRIINGEYVCQITNNATDRTDALIFEYLNNFRSSVIGVDEGVFVKSIQDIESKIGYIKTYLESGKKLSEVDGKIKEEVYNSNELNYKADKLEVVSAIADALKFYFPNITTSVVLNYVSDTNNEDVTEVVKLNRLVKLMKDIAEGVRTTRVSYADKQYQASKIRAANNIIRQQENYSEKDIKDTREIWADSFLSPKAISAINSLASAFVPYAVVKTQLNSRNASGKLSSDVINNSMISNLKFILQNHLNSIGNEESPLRHFAAFKFRGKQYNFSNILLETVENGVIINRGLFRLENGKYVPTEYADRLLKFELFNGVQDLDDGSSVLYSGMSRGDYAATAMIHFFSGAETTEDGDFADYLLRTPSDAPKNYIMTAPRYALEYKSGGRVISFWQIENQKAFDDRVNELTYSIPHYDQDYFGLSYGLGSQNMDESDAIRILSGNTLGSVVVRNQKAFRVDDTDKTKGTLDIQLTYDNETIDFIVRGDIGKRGNRTSLNNVQLVGLVNNAGSQVIYPMELRLALQNHFREELIAGRETLADGTTVKRTINRNHPIFRQMLRTATQEFQDAATALGVIFNTIDGRVVIQDGNPILAEWLQQEKDIERKLCANYHHKEIVYTDSDGTKHKVKGLIQNLWVRVNDNEDSTKWHYEETNTKILSGNVFHSDRFTLNGRNYLNELFAEGVAETEDGSIHLFYGGANTHLHVDSDGNIALTSAQQNAVEAKLEEFINDYVQHTIERVREFNNLLEGIPHTDDNIAEFILNYRIAYFNCNDLLEGDSKYYKSAQDFLKRAKEVQGSGVPYGIVDYTKPMFGQDRVLVENALINSDTEQNILSQLNDCRQYTTFRAVTIKNTIRQDENTKGILVDKLTEIFHKQGLSEDAARAKAEKMMNRYANTKVNDAQSYITFEEWIRRISARGQYYKYKPLIERILDETQELSAEDITEFVQVQKNFYYDQYFDDRLQSMRPRQIKNAEFVLVPRFIKGTQLEDVYNLMIKHGIDQLNTEETSKAGKTNVLTIWDNDGNITEENIADFEQNVGDAMEIFDYNYLYTQQETVQHINDYNKAALQIMKKILDNIDSSSPLAKNKEEFLRLYSENIYDSFATLMNELNVPLDENGNILIDEQGKINGLDYTVFMKRLEDEMSRLGLDSNMMDFVTIDDNSPEVRSGESGFGLNTRMPAYINSTKNKLESIAQAVINNRITRQKLPGFHAAQITNVGWKSNGKGNVSYSKELQYHPNGESVIQVMLPAAAFGLDRNSAIYEKVRQEAMLRYLDKAKAGEISEEEVKYLAEKEVDDAMLARLKEIGLDKLIGYRIPTEGKQSMAIMQVVGFTNDALGSTIVVPDAWVAQTGSDFDIDSVYGIQYATIQHKDGSVERIEYLGEGKDDKETEYNIRRNYIKYVLRNLDRETRLDLFEDARLDKEDKQGIKEQIEEGVFSDFSEGMKEDGHLKLWNTCISYAKKHGLESFETFKVKPLEKQNTREARMNRMVEDMLTILSHIDSLEENLSQSQFQDIIDARDELMSAYLKSERENRSCYDFFDQSDYHEDASSGAKLKARSVIRDTFCSVCNTIKPRLSTGVEIIYEGDETVFEELQKRFDIKDDNGEYIGLVEQIDDNHIRVNHVMFGWSNDNHNVKNALLTVYSSETTAHILDAIKEGAIPNVNDFTFDVYKLFPDLGSDYATCVGFMMQPGVSEIVNAYNRNKSIYANDYTKPIDGAIRSIATKLGLKTEKVPTKQLRKELDDILSEFPEIKRGIVLDASKLKDRLTRDSDTRDRRDLMFDYAVILEYENLSNIASKINKLAGVCKPDKFGAKQTIFQTKQIFQDIADIIQDDKPVFAIENGVDFLEKLYPGISSIIDGDRIVIDNYIKHSDNNSVYPSLHYFLKYSSAVSIKINETLFLTQHPNFIAQINKIMDVMSGENPRVSEDTYNAFEKYYLADIYKNIGIIGKQVSYEYGKGIVETDGDAISEISRIFGYNRNPDFTVVREVVETNSEGENYLDYVRVPFETSDINHPSEEDIDAFAQLSPAQKVLWVQQHLRDGLITKFLKVNLVNGKNRGNEKYGAQTIEFVEDGQDREYIYDEFRKTFMNSNPFLALTAMDIIKYAFVVEGYQLKHTAVNKVIDNDVLINSSGMFGTGIMESIDQRIKDVISFSTANRTQELIEKFVRSHSNMREISHTYVNKKDRSTYIRTHRLGFSTIFINDKTNEFLVNHGFGYNTQEEDGVDDFGRTKYRTVFNPNHYIKVKYGKNSEILYRIEQSKTGNVLYLSPLNILQENESNDWSANPNNNKWRHSRFYEAFVTDIEETHPLYDVSKYAEQLAELDKTKEEDKAPEQIKQKGEVTNIDFDIDDNSIGAISSIRTAIVQHFNGINGATLFIESPFLTEHIRDKNGVIKVVDGRAYLIHKINTKPYFKYTKNVNLPIDPKDAPMAELIERIRQRGIDAGHAGEARLYDIFAIDEIPTYNENEGIYSSTLTEEIAETDRAIRRDAMNSENEAATKYVQQMDNRDIESTVSSITPKIEDVVISQAEALHAQVNELLNGNHGFNFFDKNFEDGEYMSMTDMRVMDMLKDNPAMRRRYLRNILQAHHLINMYAGIQNTPLDENTAHLKYYFDKIAEDIDKLEKSDIIKKSEELFVNEYLAKISKNPNIQRNLMTLMDGWFTTDGATAALDDLQNNANPLVQIITSDCMADIRAKEMQAEERIREFKADIKKIKEDAAAKGLTINMDNIIDEYGKFVTAYDDKFLEDLDALRTARDDAYSAYKAVEGDIYDKAEAFEKVLKARLAYNKWKVKHTNQEVEDMYYYKYNQLVESMINKTTGKFYDVFVVYSMLTDQLRDILSHQGPDGLDAHWEEQKRIVLGKIHNLTSNAYVSEDGYVQLKEDLEEYQYSKDPRKRFTQVINNMSSYSILVGYIQSRRDLENEYFDQSERFGFKEQLDKYLTVVRHYEESAIPASEYTKDEKYLEAKNWIRQNAYKAYRLKVEEEQGEKKKKDVDILSEHFDVDLTEDNIPTVLNAALNYFKKQRGERNNPNSAYKRLAKTVDARDADGVIDGRKFNEAQIRTIKAEQEARFGIGESSPYSERGIIHISSNDDIIYNIDFYKGMVPDGITNPDYLAIVEKINSVLRKAVNPITGEVRVVDNLSEEELNIILDEMKKLGYDVYQQTFDRENATKKRLGVSRRKVKKIQDFIEKNVDFDLSTSDLNAFTQEEARAKIIGGSYYNTWMKMNYEWDEQKREYVPNHLFWGHAKPKPEVADKFINKSKTVALRVINKVFNEVPTKYYYLERDRLLSEFGENSEEFKTWVRNNHVYNPNKHALQPLPCWTTSEPNEYMPGEWEATWKQKERHPKDDSVNPNYKQGLGVAANFKTKDQRARVRSMYDEEGTNPELISAITSNGEYDKKYELNEGEEAMKDYLQKVLASLATTKKAKEYIERGYMPTRSIKEPEAFYKRFLKELAKGFGYVERNGEGYWEPNLTYDTDYVPNMPMLHQLTSKESIPEPRMSDFDDTREGMAAYEKAKEEWEKNKEENLKKNREIHRSLIDRDWESVMEEFIRKAAHFNAIQDNKNQLYFGLKLLNEYMGYSTYSGKLNRLSKDNSTSKTYERRKDDKLYKQYQNWLHRVIFDQYKEHGSSNKAHIMNVLQSITSMNYMTLNIRGGVANVTVGESNILGEAFAQEYFGKRNWAEGKAIWATGVAGYLANMYSETSTNLADAIIKGFHVVDYDEHTGVVSVANMEEWSKRIRDLGFSPLAMGEHFMQNSAMFSMMLSHRVVNNPNYGKPGEPKYLVQNLHEYLGLSLDETLRTVLNDEEYAEFEKYVKGIKETPSELKDYMWFRRNLVQDYVVSHLSKEQQDKFKEELVKFRQQREEEFNKAPNFYSQFKLGDDGRLQFKEDSLMAEMHALTKNNEVSDAYKAMGKFKQRVISVNKKIHGHYGKLDAAQIESKWWGGIVMQYHKHIVPGILKRWRVKGYFNEERGTIEKGSRIALFDFLRLPIKQIAEKNKLNAGQQEALKGIQNIFAMITDYCHYLSLNAKFMEKSERDNLLRNLGDVAGVVAGLLLAVLLRLGWDDDDDSFVYNFGLYQADRLSSEAFMWNPYGAMSEAKKLWSNPVAVESIINDVFSGMGVVAGMIMEGEEYDPYYHSGRFAGQHKLGVYVERRIPYWRNYIALRDIADNNHYYKMGDNMIGLINVKKLSNNIKNKK